MLVMMNLSGDKDDVSGDGEEVSGDRVLVGINCQDCAPPNMFIGTIGPDLGSANKLAPQSPGSMHMESVVRGYLSYDSNWGTIFPSVLDYIQS